MITENFDEAANSGLLQPRLVRPLPAGSQIDYCDIRASIIRDDGGSSVEVEIPGEGRMSWYWKFQGEECKIIQPNAEVWDGDPKAPSRQ